MAQRERFSQPIYPKMFPKLQRTVKRTEVDASGGVMLRCAETGILPTQNILPLNITGKQGTVEFGEDCDLRATLQIPETDPSRNPVKVNATGQCVD
ncbi:Hypp8566 [Branchiostoma lanceolatum]|uniref:Hypp8566 protein n=1 Tax=Branchiostoma lanceolatum TaxID=7740 RepID=A0A8J9Z8V1_BRALA|nr:Hypp8566 [Branchiostoma lanceolatum]